MLLETDHNLEHRHSVSVGFNDIQGYSDETIPTSRFSRPDIQAAFSLVLNFIPDPRSSNKCKNLCMQCSSLASTSIYHAVKGCNQGFYDS